MTRARIRYLRRGRVVTLEAAAASRTLLDHLRLDARATGTKEGCNEGDCGACTVVLARLKGGAVDYQAVNACILLAGQVDGAEVITVEDIAACGLHPVQQAMVRHHGSQCGFCTPGIVMSLFALYHSGAAADRAAINDCLAGNLCRCTGYRPIIDAALEVCGGAAADAYAADAAERIAVLAALEDGADVFVGDDARFFAAPRSFASLYRLLAAYPDARLLSGATDVGLWLTKKLADLTQIIWLGRVAGLERITDAADALTLGAGVSLAEAAPHLAAIAPDLGEVMRRFGSAQVRNSGTVGGNIANGSPIGDLAPCLIALGAEVVLESAAGQRRLPLEHFFLAYGKQDRRGGEIVHSLHVPKPRAGQVFRAYKVSKRFDEDISAVLGAFLIEVAGRQVKAARIAYGGMAGTPKRASATEAALAGAALDDPATWDAAEAALAEDYQPLSDARASAGYRLATAQALLKKALLECGGAPLGTTRILLPEARA
jgi:xanthine dehydrogenase small subunit